MSLVHNHPKLVYFTERQRNAINIVATAKGISASELVRECVESRGVFDEGLLEEMRVRILEMKKEKERRYK